MARAILAKQIGSFRTLGPSCCRSQMVSQTRSAASLVQGCAAARDAAPSSRKIQRIVPTTMRFLRPLLLCQAVLSRSVDAFADCAFSHTQRGLFVRARSPIASPQRLAGSSGAKRIASIVSPPSFRGIARGEVAQRALKDPQYCTNVGEAIEELREDHLHIPDAHVAPGVAVALSSVKMELAQVPGISFDGTENYVRFWDFFRTATNFLSTESRSEVVSVHQVGSQLRIRWRLRLTARSIPLTKTVRAMQNGFRGLFGSASDAVFSDMTSAGQDEEKRTVDFNSIYELDVWSGRIVAHRLEFRTPEEDHGLIRALQSSLSLASYGHSQLVPAGAFQSLAEFDVTFSSLVTAFVALCTAISITALRFRRRGITAIEEPLLEA